MKKKILKDLNLKELIKIDDWKEKKESALTGIKIKFRLVDKIFLNFLPFDRAFVLRFYRELTDYIIY